MRAERPRLVTRAFLLVTFANFAYFIAVGSTLPTLPLYVKGPLEGGNAAVGVAVGMYSIAALAFRPYVGGLGDRRGRRILMLSGASFVGVSLVGYTVAGSLLSLFPFRLLTGLGEALFFVGATSAIHDLAPDERRGEAVSLFSLSLYGGLAIGPIIGEALLRDTRFDLVWLFAAAGCAAAVALALFVPETRALQEPRSAALGDRRRFLHPAAVVPGTALLASVWGFAGFSALVALYARDLGLANSGLVFLTYAVIIIGIRSVGARIPDVIGPRTTARASLLLSASGLVLMAAWATVPGLFVATVVLSVGQALGFPAMMTLAVSSGPPSERGAIVGTFTAFFDLAYGVGALSMGWISARLGYGGSFYFAAGIAVAGFILLVVRRAGAAAAAR